MDRIASSSSSSHHPGDVNDEIQLEEPPHHHHQVRRRTPLHTQPQQHPQQRDSPLAIESTLPPPMLDIPHERDSNSIPLSSSAASSAYHPPHIRSSSYTAHMLPLILQAAGLPAGSSSSPFSPSNAASSSSAASSSNHPSLQRATSMFSATCAQPTRRLVPLIASASSSPSHDTTNTSNTATPPMGGVGGNERAGLFPFRMASMAQMGMHGSSAAGMRQRHAATLPHGFIPSSLHNSSYTITDEPAYEELISPSEASGYDEYQNLVEGADPYADLSGDDASTMSQNTEVLPPMTLAERAFEYCSRKIQRVGELTWTCLMSFSVIFSLFGEPIRLGYAPRSMDTIFLVCAVVVFGLFVVEALIYWSFCYFFQNSAANTTSPANSNASSTNASPLQSGRNTPMLQQQQQQEINNKLQMEVTLQPILEDTSFAKMRQEQKEQDASSATTSVIPPALTRSLSTNTSLLTIHHSLSSILTIILSLSPFTLFQSSWSFSTLNMKTTFPYPTFLFLLLPSNWNLEVVLDYTSIISLIPEIMFISNMITLTRFERDFLLIMKAGFLIRLIALIRCIPIDLFQVWMKVSDRKWWNGQVQEKCMNAAFWILRQAWMPERVRSAVVWSQEKILGVAFTPLSVATMIENDQVVASLTNLDAPPLSSPFSSSGGQKDPLFISPLIELNRNSKSPFSSSSAASTPSSASQGIVSTFSSASPPTPSPHASPIDVTTAPPIAQIPSAFTPSAILHTYPNVAYNATSSTSSSVTPLLSMFRSSSLGATSSSRDNSPASYHSGGETPPFEKEKHLHERDRPGSSSSGVSRSSSRSSNTQSVLPFSPQVTFPLASIHHIGNATMPVGGIAPMASGQVHHRSPLLLNRQLVPNRGGSSIVPSAITTASALSAAAPLPLAVTSTPASKLINLSAMSPMAHRRGLSGTMSGTSSSSNTPSSSNSGPALTSAPHYTRGLSLPVTGSPNLRTRDLGLMHRTGNHAISGEPASNSSTPSSASSVMTAGSPNAPPSSSGSSSAATGGPNLSRMISLSAMSPMVNSRTMQRRQHMYQTMPVSISTSAASSNSTTPVTAPTPASSYPPSLSGSPPTSVSGVNLPMHPVSQVSPLSRVRSLAGAPASTLPPRAILPSPALSSRALSGMAALRSNEANSGAGASSSGGVRSMSNLTPPLLLHNPISISQATSPMEPQSNSISSVSRSACTSPTPFLRNRKGYNPVGLSSSPYHTGAGSIGGGIGEECSSSRGFMMASSDESSPTSYAAARQRAAMNMNNASGGGMGGGGIGGGGGSSMNLNMIEEPTSGSFSSRAVSPNLLFHELDGFSHEESERESPVPEQVPTSTSSQFSHASHIGQLLSDYTAHRVIIGLLLVLFIWHVTHPVVMDQRPKFGLERIQWHLEKEMNVRGMTVNMKNDSSFAMTSSAELLQPQHHHLSDYSPTLQTLVSQYRQHWSPSLIFLRIGEDVILNSSHIISALRSQEIQILNTPSCESWFSIRSSSQANSQFNLFTMIWLILMLPILLCVIYKDVHAVVTPIERMVSFVTNLARDPLGSQFSGGGSLSTTQPGTGSMILPGSSQPLDPTLIVDVTKEMGMIENKGAAQSTLGLAANGTGALVGFATTTDSLSPLLRSSIVSSVSDQMASSFVEVTLQKLALLLQVGFGSAGGEIIAQNIIGDYLDPMIPGSKVFAVFGFCDISEFNKCTESLEESIMMFVNQIAAIVHDSCHHFGGSVNKNIGSSFLLVWKFDPSDMKALKQAIHSTRQNKVIQQSTPKIEGVHRDIMNEHASMIGIPPSLAIARQSMTRQNSISKPVLSRPDSITNAGVGNIPSSISQQKNPALSRKTRERSASMRVVTPTAATGGGIFPPPVVRQRSSAGSVGSAINTPALTGIGSATSEVLAPSAKPLSLPEPPPLNLDMPTSASTSEFDGMEADTETGRSRTQPAATTTMPDHSPLTIANLKSHEWAQEKEMLQERGLVDSGGGGGTNLALREPTRSSCRSVIVRRLSDKSRGSSFLSNGTESPVVEDLGVDLLSAPRMLQRCATDGTPNNTSAVTPSVHDDPITGATAVTNFSTLELPPPVEPSSSSISPEKEKDVESTTSVGVGELVLKSALPEASSLGNTPITAQYSRAATTKTSTPISGFSTPQFGASMDMSTLTSAAPSETPSPMHVKQASSVMSRLFKLDSDSLRGYADKHSHHSRSQTRRMSQSFVPSPSVIDENEGRISESPEASPGETPNDGSTKEMELVNVPMVQQATGESTTKQENTDTSSVHHENITSPPSKPLLPTLNPGTTSPQSGISSTLSITPKSVSPLPPVSHSVMTTPLSHPIRATTTSAVPNSVTAPLRSSQRFKQFTSDVNRSKRSDSISSNASGVSNAGSSSNNNATTVSSSKQPSSPPIRTTVHRIAHQALSAFLSTIIQIATSSSMTRWKAEPVLKARMPAGYEGPTMGFGLHVGWAIEGAIGSSHKIDASYLSPNVNLAARLCSATRQYKIPFLFSGAFYKLLDTHIQKRCRHLDQVIVKGSSQPMDLYTFDISPGWKRVAVAAAMASANPSASVKIEEDAASSKEASESSSAQASSDASSSSSATTTAPPPVDYTQQRLDWLHQVGAINFKIPPRKPSNAINTGGDAAAASAAAEKNQERERQEMNNNNNEYDRNSSSTKPQPSNSATSTASPIPSSSTLSHSHSQATLKSSSLPSSSSSTRKPSNPDISSSSSNSDSLANSHIINTLNTLLSQLQSDLPEKYVDLYNRGIKYYIAGEWQVAGKYLVKFQAMHREKVGAVVGGSASAQSSVDGPSALILKYMGQHAFQAPKGWKGYRQLEKK